MAWQNFPMITCPHCGKKSQIDDYGDINAGDCIFCPKCEKDIYIWATDITLSADIHAEPENRRNNECEV